MLDSHSGLHATYFIILQLQGSNSDPDSELDPELLHRGRETLQAIQNLHPKTESKVWSFLNNKINHVLFPGLSSTQSPQLPDLSDSDLGGIDPSFILTDNMDFPPAIFGDWMMFPDSGDNTI